jgi:hypothetical protein
MRNEVSASTIAPQEERAGLSGESDVWRVFAQADGLEAFAGAWITLVSRSCAGVGRSALLLGVPDQGPFEIIARFPEAAARHDDSFIADSTSVLRAAIEKRRPAIEDTGAAMIRIGYPLVFSGLLNGVVIIEAQTQDGGSSRRIVRHIQWSAPGIEAFLGRDAHKQGATSIAKAQFLIGAVDALAAVEHGLDAARVLANLLTRHFSCDSVAVGRYRAHNSRLVAVSQSATIDRRDTLSRAIEAAQNESIDQEAPLLAPDSNAAHVALSAHEKLSRSLGGAHVLTAPFFLADKAIGAITLRRAASSFSQAEIDLVDALGAAAGPLLYDKWRQDRSLPTLALDRGGAVLKKLFGPRHFLFKTISLTIVAIAVFLALATDTYRVRARAQIQGETRRLVSAPFDGFIHTQFARAGDVVPADFVLAELQDSDLELERLRQIAHKRQHQLELDQALAKRDLAEINIARAQIDQADAEIDLSDQMIARAKLRSPFAAVVVSGDLSQSVGKPVSRGDTLFELAPLDRYRVTAVVPESEIGFVKQGQRGQMLLSALPDQTYPVEIASVTSVAQAGDGGNGFEVIGSVEAKDQSMRPGMEGVVKIEAGTRNLAWIWVHPLVDWLRIKLWGLIP